LAIDIPRFPQKQDLPGAPVKPEEAAGWDESIHSEILSEDADDAAVDEEQVASRFEGTEEVEHPITELDV
jgi:hypothetical protein